MTQPDQPSRRLKPQQRAIEGALKVRGEFSIEKHPGLSLKSRGDGNGTFLVRYRPPGSDKKAVFTLTTDARAVLNAASDDNGVSGLEALYLRANQVLTELRVNGTDPRAAELERRNKGKTFAELFEEWFSREAIRKKRPASVAADRDTFERHIKPRIGLIALRDITKTTIRKLNEDVVRATTDAARGHYGKKANDVFAIVRRCFRWGLEHDLAMHNPCAGVKRPTTPRKRSPSLTDEQLRSIWRGLDSVRAEYRIIGRLALLLGKRISAICGMRKGELDLDGASPMWIIPPEREGNKNGEPDLVCLPPMAVALLREAVDRARSEIVFTSEGGGPMDRQLPSRCFRSLAIAADTALTFHDIRHVVGTHMARLRIPAEIRQRVLHHVTNRKASPTTDIYDEHDYLPEKREALERWQARLITIVGLRWVSTSGASKLSGTRPTIWH